MIKKSVHSLWIYCLVIIVFGGCKKDVSHEHIQNANFFLTYPLNKDQKCYTISQTDDEGFLIIGSQDEESVSDENDIIILKLDKQGSLEWSNYILGDSFNIPFVAPQKDGSFLITSNSLGSRLVKIGRNGNILFNTYFEPISIFDYYSYPLITENGQIIFSSNFERYSANSIGNFHIFNSSGQYIKYTNVSKPVSGVPADYICLYKTEDTATYYFYGIERLGFASGIPKIFVVKQVNNIIKKLIKVDANNKYNNNFSGYNAELRHIITADGSLLLYNTQLEPGGHFIGYLALVNSNLIKLWEKELRIGSNGTIPKQISICPDGNYLVCGYCKSDQNLTSQPFACKINTSGEIIWSKIYTNTNAGQFNSGMQLPDGSMVFGGTTNGFGGGKNLNDIFIMKTDENGELK